MALRLVACVTAPPSSSKLTSSPVTAFHERSGPVMDMYELPSVISVEVGDRRRRSTRVAGARAHLRGERGPGGLHVAPERYRRSRRARYDLAPLESKLPQSLMPTIGVAAKLYRSCPSPCRPSPRKTSLNEPPKIVEVCEKHEHTVGPKTVPQPVTTASPHGRFAAMSNSDSRCRTNRSELHELSWWLSSFSSRSLASRWARSRWRADGLVGGGVRSLLAQLLEPAELGLGSSRARPTSSRSLSGHRRPDPPRPGGQVPRVVPPGPRASSPRLELIVGSRTQETRDRAGRARQSLHSCARREAFRLCGRVARPVDERAVRKLSARSLSDARDNHPSCGSRARRRSAPGTGGRALLFPSGMGAVTTVLRTLAWPGHTIAVAEAAYYERRASSCSTSRRGASTPWEVRPERVTSRRGRPGAHRVPPANPTLTCPTSRRCRAPSYPWFADATRGLTTPRAAARPWVRHRPALRDQGPRRPRRRARGRCHHWRDLPTSTSVSIPCDGASGWVASPCEKGLLHRGLRTLAVRLSARQETTARLLAERLRRRTRRSNIARYPGFSFLISFDVADADAAGRVERAVRVIENATSPGAVRSKLEVAPPRGGRSHPAPGSSRLSVGLEDPYHPLG